MTAKPLWIISHFWPSGSRTLLVRSAHEPNNVDIETKLRWHCFYKGSKFFVSGPFYKKDIADLARAPTHEMLKAPTAPKLRANQRLLSLKTVVSKTSPPGTNYPRTTKDRR